MRMEGVQDFLKLCSCSFWWAYRLVSRHRPIMGLYDKLPAVNANAFVAPKQCPSSQLLSTNTPQSKQPFRYPRAHRESLHWRLLINLIFLQQIISSLHFPALFPTSYPSTHSPIPAVLLFPPSPLPPLHNDIHQWNSRSNKSRFLPMLVPRLPDGGNGETGNSRCWTDSLRWNSHAETPPTLSKYLPRGTRTHEPMDYGGGDVLPRQFHRRVLRESWLDERKKRTPADTLEVWRSGRESGKEWKDRFLPRFCHRKWSRLEGNLCHDACIAYLCRIRCSVREFAKCEMYNWR